MNEEIKKQFLEVRKKYPYLYIESNKETFRIKGTIFIQSGEIKDKHEIEIYVPDGYPKKIPVVKEIGGKIPKEYHHNQDALCLETPFMVWEIFRKEETLLNFVDNLVIPYLISYSHFKKYNTMPSGEHEHGARGVLDDYKKHFSTEEDIIALELLRILADGMYRGHMLCPCGSGNNLRNCHGEHLLSIVRDTRWEGYDFMKDYIRILAMLKKENILTDITPYISKKVREEVEKIKSKPNEKWGY